MGKAQSSRPWALSAGLALAGLACVALVALSAAALWIVADSQGALLPSRAAAKKEELAGRLRAEGLAAAALEEYEAALRLGGIGAKARGRLAYLAGNVAFEDQADFEKALEFYQRSQIYDGDAPRDLKNAIATRIKECRRRIGLRAEPALIDGPTSASLSASTVVGVVGERQVTLREIDSEIGQLSREDQARFGDPLAKREFVRWYVAQEALASEARDRGLSRDPRLRLAVARTEKEALARRLLDSEARARVRVEPDEVMAYYALHEAEFNEPPKVMAAHILLRDEEGARMAAKRLEGGADFAALARDLSRDEATRGNGGGLGWVSEGGLPLPPSLGGSAEAVKAILSLNPREVSPPVATARGVHLFKALEVQPARHRAFEEMRAEIADRLRRERGDRLEEALIQRVMRERGARVIDEAFQGAVPASAPARR